MLLINNFHVKIEDEDREILCGLSLSEKPIHVRYAKLIDLSGEGAGDDSLR